MLLVLEETKFPAENSRGHTNIRETNRRLLQKNRRHEIPRRTAQITRTAGSLGAEMCAAKLPIAQAILIFISYYPQLS